MGQGLFLISSTAQGLSSHGLSRFLRGPAAEGQMCSQLQLLRRHVTAPNSRKGGQARTRDSETEPIGEGAEPLRAILQPGL